ncbi:MAG: type II secretion system F family protein [Roseburia sp.]|nr:type II secretion system F family protein [Roseburia sp.]
MEQKWIGACLEFLPYVAAELILLLFWQLARQGQEIRKHAFLKSCGDFVELMTGRGKELTWYRKSERWLGKNGAAYHLGEKITPFRFLTARLLLAAAGFLTLSQLGISYGLLAMLSLYMLPSGLVVYLNAQDNKRLLQELKLLYHALEIQIRAGVYVTSALAECYGCVQDKRLKQALLELAGDIVMHGDLYEALERFQDKFDNRHIDSLCIIILQAMESGQAAELLSDLAEQIKDMELSALAGKKEALDRSITFYQLGILAAVMGIVLYACVSQMFSATIHL